MQLRNYPRVSCERRIGCLPVITGPNGSGKSTLTNALDFEGCENLLDPDAIARRMNPTDPGRMGVAAGRETLRRTQSYLKERTSFAIETTLASKKTLQIMQEAKVLGYAVQIVYVCLNTAERCVNRVRERALQGGHDVPDEDIRRRYDRSLANLTATIHLADRAILFDNSGTEYRKIVEIERGLVLLHAEKEPTWAATVRAALARPHSHPDIH